MHYTRFTHAVLAVGALAGLASASVTLDAGTIEVSGTAASALPTYLESTVGDTFDTPGTFNPIRFASVRSGVAGLNGDVMLNDTGASANINLLATGSFTDGSVGDASLTFDGTFTLSQATDVTMNIDSSWILGGGSGGPGYTTIAYSFGNLLSGSFDSRNESGPQGSFLTNETQTLDAGTYAFTLVADSFTPDGATQLGLTFALGFAQVPTPGAAALSLVSGAVLCTRRRVR